MAGTIKYHYALDGTGTLISVEDVCSEDRNKHRYTCLGCGAEMILKAERSRRSILRTKSIRSIAGSRHIDAYIIRLSYGSLYD